jgi:hypothetical protein
MGCGRERSWRMELYAPFFVFAKKGGDGGKKVVPLQK